MKCGRRLKKQKKVRSGSPEGFQEGDAWVYNCIKRASYLHVAYAVGKWTQNTCREMLAKLSRRVSTPSASNKLTIYSDGNDDYAYVLPEFYPVNAIDYGQVVKI